MKPGLIYLAVNRVNGKAYVGQTKTGFKTRVANHISIAATGRDKTPLHMALRKYGSESFNFAILAHCLSDHESMDAAEREWITRIGCKCPHGYNRTDGGQGVPGARYSVETRRKVSMSKMGDKNPMKNPETARKHGDSIRGPLHVAWGKAGNRLGKKQPLSEETKEKMRRYWRSEHGRDQRRNTAKSGDENVSRRPEVRTKISAALVAMWSDGNRRKQQSEKTKNTWADPQRRIKQAAGLAKMWERRKAVSNA